MTGDGEQDGLVASLEKKVETAGASGAEGHQPDGLAARVIRFLARARKVASQPAVRPWLLAVAVLAFVVMAYVSFRSLPDEGRSPNPWLVLLTVLLAAPAMLILNAAEYRAMAGALGHRIRLHEAAKVGLTATFANYLPAPGGVAVRTAALKVKGSGIGAAVSINAIAGLVWLGVAALAAGLALLGGSSMPGRGVVAVGVGVACLVAAAVWMGRSGPGWPRTFGHLLLIETGIVLAAGFRIWIALLAIGQVVPVGGAVAISSSTVVAAAVGIFPAGLGLRELIAGGLAVAVNVPVETAIAAMVVDRVSGQAGMALCVPFVGLRLFSRDGEAGDAGDVEPVAR